MSRQVVFVLGQGIIKLASFTSPTKQEREREKKKNLIVIQYMLTIIISLGHVKGNVEYW